MKPFAQYLAENNSSNVIYTIDSFEYQMIVADDEVESFLNSLEENEFCTSVECITPSLFENSDEKFRISKFKIK
jgi:hypothetical protein